MMLSTVSRNPCPTTMAGTERRVSTTTLRRIGRLLGLGAGLMCAALAACATGERPLRLGTTHTVDQSGALAVLDSLAHPVPATVIGPSGQILAAAALPTLAKLGGLRLRVVFVADTTLTNPYTLYVVRESPRRAAAQAFAQWAMDSARPSILALRLPDGTPAFVARPGGCTDRL